MHCCLKSTLCPSCISGRRGTNDVLNGIYEVGLPRMLEQHQLEMIGMTWRHLTLFSRSFSLTPPYDPRESPSPAVNTYFWFRTHILYSCIRKEHCVEEMIVPYQFHLKPTYADICGLSMRYRKHVPKLEQ